MDLMEKIASAAFEYGYNEEMSEIEKGAGSLRAARILGREAKLLAREAAKSTRKVPRATKALTGLANDVQRAASKNIKSGLGVSGKVAPVSKTMNRKQLAALNKQIPSIKANKAVSGGAGGKSSLAGKVKATAAKNPNTPVASTPAIPAPGVRTKPRVVNPKPQPSPVVKADVVYPKPSLAMSPMAKKLLIGAGVAGAGGAGYALGRSAD